MQKKNNKTTLCEQSKPIRSTKLHSACNTTSLSLFFFNDQPRATVGCSKTFSLDQQNKNVTNKHLKRSQPHYSEDEDYYSQNKQQCNANQENNIWNFDKIKTK